MQSGSVYICGLLSSCYHTIVGAKEVFSYDRARMISRIKTVQLKKGEKMALARLNIK